MSISFSGLASGLDTSSWVESLVKLKQAKITTLEEQKENVLLSKETLDGIKAFFSSFRSMIEKITDTKFGVASMDLFAQNLATSSNVSVLTGIATAEAEEATYNILVDKLATETNALSNYSYMTTIVQTTTATNASKLIHLGVKAGNIGVNVNGIERGINITENDTIATFIEKLREIGAEASYNEKTGVFSVNISDGAINDIDNTGIVDALYLRGVNEGYTSNSLQTSTTDTVFSAATESTLMKDLGVSAGVVGIKANDTNYDVTISESTTLGDFINALRANDIDASIDTEGVFTIKDAEIVSQGTTNILDALGLEADIYDKSQSSGNLTNRTIITQTTTATSDTLLKDLGEGITVNNNSTVIVKNSNNEFATITVGETSTVGDLLNAISNAGLSASINSDGIVEISGGTITGGTFDAVSALGLDSSPYTAIVTGNPLTETIETKEKVTLNTRLVEDLGVKKGYLEVTDADNNKKYLKIYSGQTIANLKSDLESYGLSCSLDESNGVLTITGGSFKALTDSEVASLVSSGKITESDATYRKGTDLLEHLYGAGTVSTDHITVESAYAKSQALNQTVTTTVNATLTTTLDKLGLTANGTAIFDVNGTKNTINVSKTMTLQGLIDALNAKGISASWDNDASKLTIENASISGGTSNLSSVLGLSETVYGKYTTSNALYSKTTSTVEATRETTLKDFGITNSQTTAQRTVNLYDSDGTKVGSMTVTEATTIGSLVDFINSKDGVSASIENGVLKINDGYISNAALEASMGLEKSNSSSYVLGSVNTTTVLSTVTGESKLGDIIAAMGTASNVSGGYNLTFDGKSISVDANSSLNDIINEIYAKGGSASLDGTGRLTVTGGTLSGSVANALGITSTTNIASISSSGKAFTTSKEVYADRDTALSELGVAANSTFSIKNASGSTIKTVTVASNATIGDFFDTLKANGIDGIISDGVITLQSGVGNYIEGSVADTLGILKRTTTTIVNTTQNSTAGITHSQTVIADLTSTLGEVGGVLSTGENNILVYDEAQNCIATISSLATTSTIEDMFNSLKSYGIRGTISNGVISLSSTNGNYVGGTIMDRLGISSELTNSETSTIALSVSSGSPLTTSVLVDASYDTKMGDIIDITSSTQLTITKGSVTKQIYVYSGMTVQQFFDKINPYATGTIENGVITIVHSDAVSMSGEVADKLGLALDKTKTVGMAATSSSKVIYSTTRLVQATDKISSCVSINTGNTEPTGTITIGGSISGGDIIGIYTADDLKRMQLGSLDNTYSGKTFVLMNDITLTASDWTGIGTSVAHFEGTFDGQGHSIKLDISNNLFGWVSGTIKNLSVYGNVDVNADTGEAFAGGIATGLLSGGLIDKCSASVTFEGSGSKKIYAGGLVGGIENGAEIRNSLVTGLAYTGNNSNAIISGLSGTIQLNGTSSGSSMAAMTDNSIICDENSFSGATFYALGCFGDDKTVTGDNKFITGNKWNGDFRAADQNILMSSPNGEASGNGKASIADCLSMYTGDYDNLRIYDKNYRQIGSVNMNNNTTFQDLMSDLTSAGINTTLSNGVLQLNSSDGSFVLGGVADKLGIERNVSSSNSPLRSPSSSSIAVTTTVTATIDSTIRDFVSGSILYVENKSGNRLATINVSTTYTFQDLALELNGLGIQMSVADGVVNISSSSGNIITGELAEQMGITRSERTVENGTNTVVTASTGEKYTINGAITADSVTGDVIGISSLQDLNNLSALVRSGNSMSGKTFVLLNDIDAGGAVFTPIGGYSDSKAFSGTFIGCGHSLKRFTFEINNGSNEQAALFGLLKGATIKDLTVSNPTMRANRTVSSSCTIAALATSADNTTIERVNIVGYNCNIMTLSASTSLGVGALVGYATNNTTINNCSTSGTIRSGATFEGRDRITCGGLIGTANNTDISGCQTSTTYNGAFGKVGGLVGRAFNSNISNNDIDNHWNLTVMSSGTCSGFGEIAGTVGNDASKTYSIVNNYIKSVFLINNSSNPYSDYAGAYGGKIAGTLEGDVRYEGNCVLYDSSTSDNVLTDSVSEFGTINGNILQTSLPKSIFTKTSSEALSYVNSNFASEYWRDGALIPNSTTYTSSEEPILETEYYNTSSGTLLTHTDVSYVDNSTPGSGASNAPSSGISNTNSSKLQIVEDKTLSLDTKLSELGVTSEARITYKKKTTGLADFTDYLTVTASCNADNTIAELIDILDEAGIKASLKNGKFTIGEDDSTLRMVMGMSNDLANALKLTIGKDNSYKVLNETISLNKKVSVSPELSLTSYIKDIEGAATILTDRTQEITIVQDGTEKIVNVSALDGSYETFEELFNKLQRYGINGYINNGRVEFDCNNGTYIKGMSNGLDKLLGLTLGENNSYSIKAENTYGNTDSNKLSFVNSSAKLSGDTVLNKIASYTAGNNQLAIHKADGTLVTITVDGTGTLDDFFNQISAYGLTGSVDSTGKVTIMGLGDTYLEAVSGGSNILTALNLSSVAKQSNVSTSNTASNVLKYNQTVAATSGTTLQNLEDALGNALTFDASGKTSLVLSKTTKSGDTSTVTLEFTKTSTLDDVIDELAKHGITATVDARGRFSVSTNSLQDFDISGTLGTFLMGSYTKDYDVTSVVNTSDSLSEKKVVKMNDGTKLSDLGITGGNILVTQNGISTTVNIDTTTLETVGDFRDFLSYYGFTTNIYNQGRISVSGEGESSLASISGGSNILDKLGLTNWTMNDVSQSSDYLSHDEIKTGAANMSNKLSELTDASGTNLGITSGQIAVYHNGTRNILNIDADETLDSLANKLSQYGITVNLASDGKLYFNGSNNSYLSKDGVAAASLSNILDKIGIADTWTTSGTSTSKKLEYQEQKVEKIDLNTKLSELKDASGNSLGITDGAFYVYSNGVRNTETIDTNMSVGDFISLMGAYGINAEIMSDGSISLKADSNSYLETSSVSGSNSNIVSKLFNNYEFKKSYASDKLEVTKSETNAITRDTKLSDINEGTYQAGYITVVKDGVNTNIEFSENDTIGTFIDKLALYGFNATINGNGQLVMNSTGNSELKNYTGAGASNVLDILGVNETNWIKTNKYQGDELNVVKKSTTNVAATRDTKMSELGVTTGEYYIYNNGVKYTAMISSDETLGSFMDTLKSFGLETSIVEKDGASVLSVVGKGNSYVSKSSSVTNASNVVEKLFSGGVSTSYEYNGLQQTSEIVTTYSAATEDTLLSYFDNGALKAEGDLSVSVNGIENTIKITADETFGSLIDKLKAIGVEATMTNGQLLIQSGYDSFTINTSGTTSNLQATINLMYDNDLGGYVASSDTVLSTTTTIEEKTLSVSNYADSSTKLGQLNISNGALTVYRNGQKATIQINSDETFGDLQSRLSNAFSDLDLKFEDGYLTIYSKDGNNVEVGATTDTTNFSAITGVTKNEDGTVKSARELYRVNGDSVVTDSGLFRSGNVKEGTFIIGNETFTIDDKTTLSDIISQINSNEKANATAYWDNIKGRLVIKSRTTGAAYVNIEAGTSNFTDVMGFTTSEWNADGSLKETRMNINNQEIGQNARISINGTNYTSTSNTITSDVSRIKGLTIKLNGLTEGSAVTLTVEKDKETLANAVSDVIDSYNELMKNVDEAISKDGKLNRETTLKMIRNNLRNIMTSSDAGTTVYRNLSAIGISTSTASANNISTSNESVINLAFDKEKFIEAYEADSAAVKALLTGSENNKGVFTKVEELMESALQSVTGYFASADNSFTKQAETIERKIVNGTKQIERYRARLEARFSSMDMLIANMQQQYSSFLIT